MSGGICIGTRIKGHQKVTSIVCIAEEDGMTGSYGMAMRWH